VGQPYDAATLSKDVKWLWGLGRFSDVRVDTAENEDGVDVVFHVTTEPRYGLRDVRFEPHSFGLEITIPPGTLLTQAMAQQVATSARTQLIERGYPDATVNWRFVPAGSRFDLIVSVDAGKQARHRPKDPPLPAAPRALCDTLFAERRESEREGILDFSASLDDSGVPSIERGPSYTLGRLTFYGHHHYSDALIRSHFLIDEGDPLDMFKLRQSVVRLNRAGLFDTLDEHQVHVTPNDSTGTADVTIYLHERKRHAWSFSGPVPMTASITGRVIGTYALGFHLVAFSTILKLATNKRLLPVFSAERAFTPGQGWWSGISFAPQLGLRGTVLSYASTQFQQRLLPVLAGTRAPDLTVSKGDDTLLCKYPKPRFFVARTGASLVLRFAGQIAGM
jgi:outer membrane protein insertion porin family